MRNLLFCFMQMGGANALLPLFDSFDRKSMVTGRRVVEDILVERGLDVTPFDEIQKEGATAWMRRHRIELLVTDTMNMGRDLVEGTYGRTLWAAAREAGIPSIAYVDSWWAYDERFRLAEKSLPDILPDRIALIDDYPRPEMQALGYDQERMVTLGSPHFENLRAPTIDQDCQTAKRTYDEARSQWGVAADDLLIVFTSQPFEALYKSSEVWGFTEKTTLRDIVEELAALPDKARQRLHLLVALHPEEDEAGMQAFLNTLEYDFSIQTYKGPDTLEALAVCDLACGMFSILLTEAVIMERPTLSVQINLKREDMAITNLVGATVPIRSRSELAERLPRILTNPDERSRMVDVQRRFTIVENSRQLWIGEIERLTGSETEQERVTNWTN